MSQDQRTALYFAYGSNMLSATFVERRRVAATAARSARLLGYDLCFDIAVGKGKRGCANLAPREGASTHGVLWSMPKVDVERFGETEGVPRGFYNVADVAVEVENESDPSAPLTLDAFTLISPHRDPSRKPSLRYMEILLAGAREHRLPGSWIARLVAWELAWDEREGAINPSVGSRTGAVTH